MGSPSGRWGSRRRKSIRPKMALAQRKENRKRTKSPEKLWFAPICFQVSEAFLFFSLTFAAILEFEHQHFSIGRGRAFKVADGADSASHFHLPSRLRHFIARSCSSCSTGLDTVTADVTTFSIISPCRSALKFQLQIERPWGHNLSHFRSKTGFQKCTQGHHFVANKLFWGCVWVYIVRLCNHFVAAFFG